MREGWLRFSWLLILAVGIRGVARHGAEDSPIKKTEAKKKRGCGLRTLSKESENRWILEAESRLKLDGSAPQGSSGDSKVRVVGGYRAVWIGRANQSVNR